jgi:drug/metabolite transporter (DMT)-like permease
VAEKPITSYAPLTIGFFRFFFATILFLIFMPVTAHSLKKMFSRSNLKWYILLGATGVFGYGVFFLFGMGFTTAAQGALIARLNPAFVSIFAHIIHNERLAQKWRYNGFLLAFLGIILVIGIQVLLDFHKNWSIHQPRPDFWHFVFCVDTQRGHSLDILYWPCSGDNWYLHH